ncbi:restriction endonuclease subunit S [Xanthomonas sp. 3307]|uniref:restriction endonuclease subunit S n=1 Tax=Xanthomonas sp. 3307 TaxID=3035316 RepID=UPI00160952C0|nr:restriction endonuclease subunit S [Xanthomonas sp. 3307]MBB5942784.1 type I restriction enzyme S subunit [Xanthomonas sp. 3307]
MFPKDWRHSTIGESTKLLSGNTPSKENPAFWSGDFPWVTVRDMKTLWLQETGLTLTESGKAAASIAPANSVLVVTRGMALLKDLPVSLAMRDVAFNQDIKAMVPIDNLDARFLAYQLQSKKHVVLDMVDTAGHGTGKLDTSLLKSVDLALPPIREQRRIAHILSTWDQAIASTEQLLANAGAQRKALTNQLFIHGRHSSMTTHGWKFVDLDEIFERVTRRNSVADSNVLTISGTRGLVSQRNYFNKSVASQNLAGYTLLERGEFAYNKSYSAGYPMGAIKPLTRYDRGAVSSLYICFRLRNEVEADADFFRHYFEVGMLNEGLAGIAQEGARNHGLLNVGVGDFFKLRLHIPDMTEQRRIAAILNMAEQKEKLIAAQLDKLRDEKKALMSQLLTGKRRVRLTADEAAST